jgi:tripartite-type tricarboxylate transporter receptor subunit TctC
MVSRREVLCSLAAAGSLAVTLPARAAGYPTSAVRLVLPYTSGSDDVQARIIARSLGGFLGQPIVVDAHPGAGGNVAAHYVAHASADGYTLLFATNSMLEVNPLMYADPGFNPLTDFAPVSFLAEHPFMLVVNPQVPARTVRELIDYGRKNPDKLTNATAGAGSALYLAGLQFMSKAGIRIVNVPYKGGAEDTLAVLSGAVSMEFGGVPNVRAYVQARKRACRVLSSPHGACLPRRQRRRHRYSRPCVQAWQRRLRTAISSAAWPIWVSCRSPVRITIHPVPGYGGASRRRPRCGVNCWRTRASSHREAVVKRVV